MKTLLRSGACIALLAISACSSAPQNDAFIPSSNADGGGGDSSAQPSDGGLTEEAGDAAANPSDGGADASNDGGTTPLPAAVCDPLQMWGAAAKIPLSTAQEDTLVSVTSDERSLTWITPIDNAVYYADRDDPAQPFGAAKILPTAGLALGERVAITFDGLTLYAIRSDRQGLVAFARDSRADSFATHGTLSLDNLNAEGASLGAGNYFTDLVVSNTVLLLRVTGGASAGIRLATRALPGEAWSATSPFAAQSELAISGGKARRPTGISSDRRALFYWDEVSMTEKVALFPFDTATATAFVDIGDRASAQPNSLCTSLYYSATGDLFLAPKK